MLQTPEAAEYVGVSEDTLRRWRRRTRREGRQIGPTWHVQPLRGLVDVIVYDEIDLDRWKKDRAVVA